MTILRDAITVAWLSWTLWLGMMIFAFLIHVLRRHPHDTTAPAEAKKLIIQITTIGDDIVADTIRKLRSALGGRDTSLYEIWVVTEPSDPRSYPSADLTLVVPPGFQTSQQTKFKGRALEYARLYRIGSLTDYKALLIDDDSTVSAAFIDECYERSFDLLQGPVTVSRPRGILSNLDAALRAMSCLSFCSFFQEISHQLVTHGEGFCISEEVERAVSWDHPGWYAEDLVYGATATRTMGFRMRSTYATLQTNCPIGISQYIKQRRRWYWSFIRSRYLLPRSVRAELWSFYILGLVVTPLAVTGIFLGALGIFYLPAGLTVLSRVLFVLWFLAWGYSGYFAQRRVRGVVVGALSSLVAPLVGFIISLIGIIMGPAQTFEVMKRAEVRAER